MITPNMSVSGVNSDVTTITYAVMFQLVYINHSGNFPVYVLSNRRFREEVKKVFCSRFIRVHPENDSSEQTKPDES